MKVAITGATGFLGSHLAELLIERGHSVRAIVRGTSNTKFLERLGVELAEASLSSGKGLEDAVRGVDGVVHSAGVVKALSPEGFHEVNAGGTAKVLDAVRAANPGLKRFVYVSSLTAHGFSQDGRARAVGDEATPVSHYGRSKLAGERLVLDAKDEFPVTVIRPPAIYGPRDTEMFAFFEAIQKFRVMPFMGSSKNVLSIIYARDCANAIFLALTKEHPSGRVYFVEDGVVYSQEELGSQIAEALGVSAMKFSVPIGVVSAVAALTETFGRLRKQPVMLTRDKVNELKQRYLHCASDDIRRDLGWAPEIQLREGAKITAKWYRENGWL